MKWVRFACMFLAGILSPLWAQNEPEGWLTREDVFPTEIVETDSIDSFTGQSILPQGLQVRATSISSSDLQIHLPVHESDRIHELARGLDYDWGACYRFVHDAIRFVPYYGILRGPERTLLDRAGNDADQALLLCALLRESGYTATVVYEPIARDEDGYLVSGFRLLTSDVARWVRVPAQESIEDLRDAVGTLLATAGYSVVFLNRSEERWIGMDHFWVELTLDGVKYYLDPSFKQTNWTEPRDIASNMHYQREALLASAGGTVSNDSVQNIATQSLESTLNALSSALRSSWSESNASATNFLGPSILEPAPENTTFSGQYSQRPIDFLAQSEAFQNAFRATVSLTYGGLQSSFFLDELGARHVWLSFSANNKASLFLDETLLATESASSTSTSLSLSVNYAPASQSATYSLERGAHNVYAIPVGFGDDARGGMRTWATEEIGKLRASGGSPNDPQRISRGLQLAGQQWLAQSALVSHFRNVITRRSDHAFYTLGVAGQTDAPYVDIRNRYSYAPGRSALFHGELLFFSALEHAVLDQLNGTNRPSVSTLKILDLANASGHPIYFANAANFASIRNQLQGYSASMLNSFQQTTASGRSLLLPKNGNIAFHQWSGYGYIEHGPTSHGSHSTAMMIGGGLHGGLGSVLNRLDSVEYWYETRPTTTQANGGVPESVQADPVAMPAGAYLDRKTDLVLNSRTPLVWSRNYDSRSRTIEGDLGRGWSHNFEASITECADPDAVFGRTSVDAAIPTAVAMTVVNDLLSQQTNLSAGELARRWTIAALTVQWWTKQFTGATISVNLGAQSLRFQRRPDGSFAPYPGVTASLTCTNGNYTLTERHGPTYTFNSNHRLASITDRSGNVTTLTYNANHLLTRIENDFGGAFSIAWNDNRISSVTDSAGRSIHYNYNADGCLTSVTDPCGQPWLASYDPASLALVSQTDPDGNITIQNAYNSLGQVTNQISAIGEFWHFGYVSNSVSWDEDPHENRLTQYFNDEGRVTARSDRDDTITRTWYDGHGHAIASQDALGRTDFAAYDGNDNLVLTDEGTDDLYRLTDFVYDADNRLVAITNALGDVTSFTYDPCDRLLSQTRPDGSSIVHTWSPNGLLLSTQARDANQTVLCQTTFTYGPLGLPITQTTTGIGLPAAGITEFFSYTETGLLESYTDANSHTSTFTYDARGKLLTSTTPDTATTAHTYTPAGRLHSATDALGRITTTFWTPSGKFSHVLYPDGSSRTNTYDAIDRLATVTDARGSSISFARDAIGRILQRSTASGTNQFLYNAIGLPIAHRDGANITTYTGYDGLYRPILTQNALGHSWKTTYDLLNHPLATIDPRGKIRTATYDSIGQQTSSVKPSGATTYFGYDGLGFLVAITNAEGHVATQSFDALGRLLSATDATGHTLFNASYDGVGNLISRTDGNGDTLTYSYDACNRLTHRSGPNTDASFAYDAVGNLLSASNDTATASFAYDAMDRLASATTTLRGSVYTTAWQRDAAGLVTNLVYTPNQSVAYTYDPDGRLSSVTDWLGHTWSFSYDGAGKPTGGIAPDAIPHSFSYDDAGQLSAWSVGTLAGRSIQRDAAGRRIRDTITIGSTPAATLSRYAENTFDAADRITSASIVYNVTNAPISETYHYDQNGALTNVLTVGESTFSASYTALSQLAAVGPDSFAYDALGNRVLANDRLWIPNHDDPLKRPLLECASDGTILRAYLWANGRLLGFIDANNTLTIAHSDEQGNVIALTDALGTVLHTAHYGPHGEDWGRTGTNPTPFTWLGGYGVQTLSTTSTLGPLYLTRHRLYSATLTRFLSADPLGFSGGLNMYAYGNNNPLLYIDPLGLSCTSGDNGFWSAIGNSLSAAGEYSARAIDSVINFVIQFSLSNPNFRERGFQDAIDQASIEMYGSPLQRLGLYGKDEPITALPSDIVGTAWDIGAALSVPSSLFGEKDNPSYSQSSKTSVVPDMSSTITLYHGGLINPKLFGRPFSLSPDIEYARAYAERKGEPMLTFEIPNNVINEMIINDTLRTITDNYKNTFMIGPEYRFSPKGIDEVLLYKKD